MRVGKSATAPITAKAKQAGNAVLNGTATALAHPFKSARKLGGVVNKKFGQAQKAAGVTQGIAGNLAMAAGIKGGEDLIKKGEGLYNKGQGAYRTRTSPNRQRKCRYLRKPEYCGKSQ